MIQKIRVLSLLVLTTLHAGKESPDSYLACEDLIQNILQHKSPYLTHCYELQKAIVNYNTAHHFTIDGASFYGPPLLAAILVLNTEFIKELAEKTVLKTTKKQSPWKDKTGWSFIHYAAFYAPTDIESEALKELNYRKTCLNSRDRNGKTPLMLAAESKNLQAFILLIKMGANFKEKDNNNKTFFEYAENNHTSQSPNPVYEYLINPTTTSAYLSPTIIFINNPAFIGRARQTTTEEYSRSRAPNYLTFNDHETSNSPSNEEDTEGATYYLHEGLTTEEIEALPVPSPPNSPLVTQNTEHSNQERGLYHTQTYSDGSQETWV